MSFFFLQIRILTHHYFLSSITYFFYISWGLYSFRDEPLHIISFHTSQTIYSFDSISHLNKNMVKINAQIMFRLIMLTLVFVTNPLLSSSHHIFKVISKFIYHLLPYFVAFIYLANDLVVYWHCAPYVMCSDSVEEAGLNINSRRARAQEH